MYTYSYVKLTHIVIALAYLQCFDAQPALVRAAGEAQLAHAGREVLEDVAVTEVLRQALLDALVAPRTQQHLGLLHGPVDRALRLALPCSVQDRQTDRQQAFTVYSLSI